MLVRVRVVVDLLGALMLCCVLTFGGQEGSIMVASVDFWVSSVVVTVSIFGVDVWQ